MQSSTSILDLPFSSSLIRDYFADNEKLKPFYQFEPTNEGLNKAIQSKKTNFQNREILIEILNANYPNFETLSEVEKSNINALKSSGLAITTAHQPNLFGGPLYTITKACSTIKLAQTLSQTQSEIIVPIFIIGSEDHDKEELLHTFLFGKKNEWETAQTGAIGSMKIDAEFLEILNQMIVQFGNMPHAEDLRNIFLNSYQQGETIAKGFSNLLKKLFGSHGLIVLDLNLSVVKKTMIPVFEQELKEGISSKLIQSNLEFLQKEYKIQASPREINLFEFKNGERVRIDQSSAELISKLHSHPELFSPNVILRPLMQQTVIPSIANIGGMAEVAYWLQLKPIFDEFKIDFPAILLRDMLIPLDQKSLEKWQSFGFEVKDFFRDIDEMKRNFVLKDSSLESDFDSISTKIVEEYSALEKLISTIDKSLINSIQAEKTKTKNSISILLQKTIKAEKKKNEEELNAIEKIKNKVYEGSSLIERKENFSAFYLKNGSLWIEKMIESADPIKLELKILAS